MEQCGRRGLSPGTHISTYHSSYSTANCREHVIAFTGAPVCRTSAPLNPGALQSMPGLYRSVWQDYVALCCG